MLSGVIPALSASVAVLVSASTLPPKIVYHFVFICIYGMHFILFLGGYKIKLELDRSIRMGSHSMKNT